MAVGTNSAESVHSKYRGGQVDKKYAGGKGLSICPQRGDEEREPGRQRRAYVARKKRVKQAPKEGGLNRGCLGRERFKRY